MKHANNTPPITVQELYDYARKHHLTDAPIRICDGMAVSYYPDLGAVKRGRYQIVIDVSANEPLDYDDLDPSSRVVFQ